MLYGDGERRPFVRSKTDGELCPGGCGNPAPTVTFRFAQCTSCLRGIDWGLTQIPKSADGEPAFGLRDGTVVLRASSLARVAA